jgi:nicotinamide mononucleotide transporter
MDLQVIDTIKEQAAGTGIWEWIAVLAGVAEVLLARANKVLLYPAGIISVLITIVLYIQGGLYAESFLNVYYLVMSIYGWAHWMKRKGQPQLLISHATKAEWGITTVIILAGWLLMWLILHRYTNSTVPSADAFVAATGWAGMWLLARRKMENWLVLNLSNLVAIPLLYSKGFMLYSALSAFLFIVAIFGFIEWRKLYKKQLVTVS